MPNTVLKMLILSFFFSKTVHRMTSVWKIWKIYFSIFCLGFYQLFYVYLYLGSLLFLLFIYIDRLQTRYTDKYKHTDTIQCHVILLLTTTLTPCDGCVTSEAVFVVLPSLALGGRRRCIVTLHCHRSLKERPRCRPPACSYSSIASPWPRWLSWRKRPATFLLFFSSSSNCHLTSIWLASLFWLASYPIYWPVNLWQSISMIGWLSLLMGYS